MFKSRSTLLIERVNQRIHQQFRQTNRALQSVIRRRNSTITDASLDSNPFISSKDALRLGVTFGVFGTMISYFDIQYQGEMLIFKMSMPSAERFCFFGACWAVAGMMSWLVFWTRPIRLVMAAAGESRAAGFWEGVGGASIAMGAAMIGISSMSLYFDYNDYRANPTSKEFDTTQHLQTLTLVSSSSAPDMTNDQLSDGKGSITSDDCDGKGDSSSTGVNGASISADAASLKNSMATSLDSFLKANHKADEAEDLSAPMEPGVWDWRKAWFHLSEPCREFSRSNGVLWLVCGIPAAVVASKMMAAKITLIATAIATGTLEVGGASSMAMNSPAITSAVLMCSPDLRILRDDMARICQDMDEVMAE